MSQDAQPFRDEAAEEHTPTRISGRSARRAASWFNWGNIIAMIVPLPLAIFWTGLSMLVYALNRHHPNPKVGHYTQIAAYRFYAIAGTAVVIGTFAPPSVTFYLVLWAIAAVIIIPWSLYDLYRIKQDNWEDSFTEPPESFEDQ
ncbi:MAG: hypothetical protein ACLFMY_04460 [Guyparkeria sp.]|uniref:hypothetical protein n=1 Tax=Guyparkeria sp. TaxID=2035736 RepID=UPI00397A4B60